MTYTIFRKRTRTHTPVNLCIIQGDPRAEHDAHPHLFYLYNEFEQKSLFFRIFKQV